MKTHLRTLVVALLAIVCAVGNINAQAGPTISTNLPATAKAYAVVPFTVDITKGNATATNMNVVLKLSDNAATQATQIELKAGDGTLIPLTGTETVIHTASTFPDNLNLNYTAMFKAVGTFAYTLELRDASALLASTSQTTVVSFLEPTVNTTLDNVSAGPLKIRTNEEVLFRLYANPNDRTGDMVNLRLRLADPAQYDNFSLMYATNAEETEFAELTVGADGGLVFGPEGGFEFSEAIDQLMKINFTEVGEYTYTFDVLRVDGNVTASVTETVNVLEGATVASTLDGTTIIKDRQVDFVVNLDAGSWPNDTKVLARVVLADPAQASNIQLFYEASADNYQPLTFDAEGVAYYGDPVQGINLADGTLNMRVIANETGTYNYRIELVKVIDGQLAAVSEETVTVRFINPTISSDLNNRAGVTATVAEVFTTTITAGDVDPSTKVFGKLTLADPAQAANIKIEVQDLTGTYMQIPIRSDGTIAIGEDGEITLGQLGSLDFRVTFNNPGTYAYKLELIRVSDNAVLASSEESVTVTAFQNATVATTLDARESVKATIAEEFTVSATAGNVDPTTMVLGRLTLATPAQAEDIALEYFDTADNMYKPVAIGTNGVVTIGPTGGMMLSQVNDLRFRATFDAAGAYGYKVELVRASDNTVLATSDESVTVAAFDNATLASNYVNADNILAGEPTTFTLTTTKGDLTNRTARFKFMLADASKANNIIIENTDASESVRLVFGTDGVAYYMPVAGPVAVSDQTYNFTAQFTASGDYNYTVQLIDATTAEVLASTNVSVAAKTTTAIKKGFEKGGFAVYPTLTTRTVKIDLVNARNANIQVVDMLGRAVVTKENMNGVVELDLSKVAKGTYIVRIQDGGNVNTQRVVVR